MWEKLVLHRSVSPTNACILQPTPDHTTCTGHTPDMHYPYLDALSNNSDTWVEFEIYYEVRTKNFNSKEVI